MTNEAQMGELSKALLRTLERIIAQLELQIDLLKELQKIAEGKVNDPSAQGGKQDGKRTISTG